MDVQPMEQGVSWAEAWAESARNPAAWRRGGGPMGQLRIEVPAFLCGRPGRRDGLPRVIG